MNDKLEKLNQEIEKGKKKLHRLEHEEKILQNRAKQLTRNKRTHRLCTREAALGSYLPHPELVTDEQVSTILKLLFHRSENQKIIEQGTLHFPCAGCRQLPFCGLAIRGYFAMQAVPR